MRFVVYCRHEKQKWDSELLGLIAAIYKEVGKQDMFLKQKPQELEKLAEIAKVHSTEASNAIEGIATNRKSSGTGMSWASSMKALTPYRSLGITFFSCTRFCTAT